MLPFAATWNLENIILSDVSLIEKDKYHIISCICEILKKMTQMKHKLEVRFLGEISVTSDMQMTPPFGRKWRTKEPLDESERGEWKSWLTAQHSEN